MATLVKKKKTVGFTDKEWEDLKKERLAQLMATCGPVRVRRPGTMKGYFSFTRPKNGKVYQFGEN